MKRIARYSMFGFALVSMLAFAPTSAFAQDDEGGGDTNTLEVDPAHTKIMARADHFGVGYVFVEFLDVSGAVQFNEENPTESSIELTVKTASLESHQEKRNKHLKGPDFFNAKKYPNLKFEGEITEKLDEKTFQVAGELTLRGETKPLEIKVKQIGSGKDPEGKFRRGFYTEFEINRMDFGIDWKPKASSEMVRIIMSLEAVRE